MNKVKYFFSIFSILICFLYFESCSSLFHNSTDGKITFALNLSEIYGSRNASIENNINEIQQDSLTISLFDIDDSLIDSKTVIFNYPSENIITIAFDAIPIGKKIYATAKLIFNNKEYSYDGKDNPLIIKDGTNVLPIDLELNVFESLYLLFSEIKNSENIPSYNVEMIDDLNSLNKTEFTNVLDFTVGGEGCFYYATVKDDFVNVIKSDDVDNSLNTGEPHSNNYKLYYDYENDKLYGLGATENFSIDDNQSSINPIDFVVYNETYYLAYNKSMETFISPDIYIGTFNISDDGSTYNCEKSIKLELNMFGDIPSISDITIKDMIAINGKLYVLWSCYGPSISGNNIKSYGGVLVVDINTFEVINLLGNFYSETAFNVSNDNNQTQECKYYGPNSIDDTASLFGPSKVIAIKPKKLVVADEGIFVFTDDDGNPKYKNVNRVVEIDLLNPSNITQHVTSATFYKDITNPIQVVSNYASVEPATE